MNQVTAKPGLRVVQDDVTIGEISKAIESGASTAMLDVLITPAIARYLLTFNSPGETNRRMKTNAVDASARAMRDGKWKNTGEPIIVARGLLNDGQHRLQAVVKADVPVLMDLRFGIGRDAFPATNSGSKRTGADALT